MRVRFWGTRGSTASPGPDTTRYGGNTSCVQVEACPRSVLVLDAGTGIRGLDASLRNDIERVDILITHLHLDHIQGLGFFMPLRRPGLEVHLWGPASTTMDLGERLSRYLSPPLFPVHLRDLACEPVLHEVARDVFRLPGDVTVTADLVCHPGPTVGYRLEQGGRVLTYLPDHEPRLGSHDFPHRPQWTSGCALASGADLLVHDAQYTEAEYRERPGWGHSSVGDAVAFAAACGARRLLLFHHDPAHDDQTLDRLAAELRRGGEADVAVDWAREGESFEV